MRGYLLHIYWLVRAAVLQWTNFQRLSWMALCGRAASSFGVVSKYEGREGDTLMYSFTGYYIRKIEGRNG